MLALNMQDEEFFKELISEEYANGFYKSHKESEVEPVAETEPVATTELTEDGEVEAEKEEAVK